MKTLAVEMACLLGIQNDIQEMCTMYMAIYLKTFKKKKGGFIYILHISNYSSFTLSYLESSLLAQFAHYLMTLLEIL